MSLYTFILVQFCSSRNFGTHATQKQFFRLFIIIYLFIILASDTLGPNIIYFRGFFPLEPPILIVSLLHRSRETKCNILIYIKMNLISSLGVKNCKIFSINQIVSLGFEFSIATLVTGSQFKYQGKKLSNFNLKISLHLKGGMFYLQRYHSNIYLINSAWKILFLFQLVKCIIRTIFSNCF